MGSVYHDSVIDSLYCRKGTKPTDASDCSFHLSYVPDTLKKRHEVPKSVSCKRRLSEGSITFY